MRPTVRAWSVLRVQKRAFSSTTPRLERYGFVGLGQMVCHSISARFLQLVGVKSPS